MSQNVFLWRRLFPEKASESTAIAESFAGRHAGLRPLIWGRHVRLYATIIIKRLLLTRDSRATPPHRQNQLSVAHIGNWTGCPNGRLYGSSPDLSSCHRIQNADEAGY